MAVAFPPPRETIEHGQRAGTPLDVDQQQVVELLPGRRVSLGMFVLLSLLYGYIGYRTTIDAHVVVFDALDRLSRSYLVWHNNPPKLAAVGFVFPPLTTMAFLPFAVVKPVATSLVALPVSSAMFAAGTVVVLDRTLARCDINALLRYPLLAAFGLNPFWLFYAGNGMSEVVYSFFLAFMLYSFVSWYATTEPRYLIAAGFALSILVLVRYAFIVWALLLAVLIGVALIRRAARRIEVEGSIIAFASPIIYVLALWILFNALIIGDPFGWVSDTTTSTQAINATGISDRGSLGLNDVAQRLLELNVAVFPLAFVAVPALVATFASQRNDMALWLASFVVLGIVIIGAHAFISDKESLLTLRDSMPMYLASFVGAAWLYRSWFAFRLPIFAATMVLLIIGMFTAWHGMKTYPFQSLEQAFTRTLFSGKDQEGRGSRGGYTVGIASEARMADFIDKQIPQKRNSILADDAQVFGVILLSGRPQNVLDRVDEGDGAFQKVLKAPFGKVDYLLYATNARSGDIIRRQYPTAESNLVGGLSVVFRTERYVLVKVAAKDPSASARAAAAAAARRSAAARRAAATQTFAPSAGGTTSAPAGGTTGATGPGPGSTTTTAPTP